MQAIDTLGESYFSHDYIQQGASPITFTTLGKKTNE